MPNSLDGVKMADLKRPKESLKPQNVGKISPDPYSFEHRISLDADALNKLGMDKMPKVGDEFHVLGHATVHSVEDSADSLDGKVKNRKRVGLQFKKLGLQPKAEGGAFGAVSKGINEANES